MSDMYCYAKSGGKHPTCMITGRRCKDDISVPEGWLEADCRICNVPLLYPDKARGIIEAEGPDD